MDKKLLNKLSQTKNRFDDIMALRKAGKKDPSKYDEIFEKYGQTIYNNVVPYKHRKNEIKKLMKEGRFEDIYFKHGKTAYNDNIYKMQTMDVYNETGSKPKSIANRIKNVIAHRIAPVFLSTLLIAPPTGATAIEMFSRQEKAENRIEYAEELEKYDARISEYANEVNSMNLTHTQVFMKLMSDMWQEIDGYGEETIDVTGLLRLSLQENGQGVCRHFADDITAKLNAINPEYNARNLAVYMEEGNYRLANIERNIIQSNNTVAGSEEIEQEQDGFDWTKVIGNHAVTVVDIPGENLSLVLDPTNPGIGVFKNGEIYMFSTPDGKGITPKSIGQFFMNGAEGNFDLGMTSVKSFLNTDKSIEELNEIYGTEAQNEALEYLESFEVNKTKDNSFDNKIKVKDEEILHKIENVSKEASEKQEAQNQVEQNITEVNIESR